MKKLDLSKKEDRNKLVKRILLYFFIYLSVGGILSALAVINFCIATLIFILTTIGDIFINTDLISSIFAKKDGKK